MRTLTMITALIALLVVGSKVALASSTDRIAQGDITIEAGERVNDAVSLGGSLVVRGWVTGDAVSLGGGVRLMPGARVDGDITALGGSVVVEPGAVAFGSQTGLGERGAFNVDHDRGPSTTASPSGASEAVDSGSSDSVIGRWVEDRLEGLGLLIKKVGHMLALYGLIVVLGLIMLGVAPLRTRALAAAVATHPGKSLGLGLLVILGAILAIIVLAISVVGIPFAAILAVVVGCAAVLGLTGVSILIGELLPFRALRDRSALKLLVGAGLLVVALAIPYAGGVLGVLATIVGLGSLALTRMRPGHMVFNGRAAH